MAEWNRSNVFVRKLENAEPDSEDIARINNKEVSDQNPFPGSLHYKPVAQSEYLEVDDANGFPVQVVPGPIPAIWQLRDTGLIQVAGVATQNTAYTALDAVGTGQAIPNMGGPNHAVVIHGWLSYYDKVPTTSEIGLGFVTAYGRLQTVPTDNGALTLSPGDNAIITGNLIPGAAGVSAIPAGGAFSYAQGSNTLNLLFPTAADGSLWLQGYCATAFTVATGGNVFVRFLYRWANFAGMG